MTRVNCVPPSELHRAHLVAEYRELPRCFGLILAAQARGERRDDPRNPARYVLGRGHLRFFYARGLYLLRRQTALVAEMRRRGYTVNHGDPSHLVHGVDPWRLMDWTPDDDALALNRTRLAERLAAMEERA